MTKIIALLALMVAAVSLQLANYWYTFGLWPKSWTSFTLCALASMVITHALGVVMKEQD